MKTHVAVFVFSALAGSLGSVIHDAAAYDRRMSAFFCTGHDVDPFWGYYSLSNPAGSSTRTVACGVPNDSLHPLTTVLNSSSAIQAHFKAATTNGAAACACVSYFSWQSPGGACGTCAWNGSSTGSIHLNPDASVWRNGTASDAPYLFVVLGQCAKDYTGLCMSYNELYGYTVVYD